MSRFVNPMFISGDKQKGRGMRPPLKVEYLGKVLKSKDGTCLPKTALTLKIVRGMGKIRK